MAWMQAVEAAIEGGSKGQNLISAIGNALIRNSAYLGRENNKPSDIYQMYVDTVKDVQSIGKLREFALEN